MKSLDTSPVDPDVYAAPTTELAIETRDVVKSYGGRQVLCGIDLQVRRGEVFCLLGPNGAGKTTTVEILEGLRDRDGGHVSVLGHDPARHEKSLRERVGVVLQECGFPRHLRVGELLDSTRQYYPRNLTLDELLDLVSLRPQADQLVRKLSGGQRRRLDFALALAGDPELVFLDEPTTGFDPEARLRCWKAIENLRALGKTIVLTTHYLDEAEHLADRLAIIVGGRVELVGTPREVARRTGARTVIEFTLGPATSESDLPEIAGLVVAGKRARAYVDDVAGSLQTLLSWTTERGPGALEDLRVTPPTLEDMYRHYFAEPEEEPQ